MRIVKSDFIRDQLRLRKTTTITDWAPRVTGEHATWMQRGGKQWRRRERNEERKKAKKIKLRVATFNVGTMTGKGREVVCVGKSHATVQFLYSLNI